MASITLLNSRATTITNEEKASNLMALQIWEWTSSKRDREIHSCFIMVPKLLRSVQLMALSKNRREANCKFK